MSEEITTMAPPPPPDLTKPLYDQNTYAGRVSHFFRLTNPLNLLASDAQLNEAKRIVDTYNKSKRMPEGYNADKLWSAKYLVDSAFHPDTGEKMILPGRMAAQMPMNTFITGAMVTFYKSTAATVFWQWFNQTFNAVVNYTNRSGDAVIPKGQVISSYCCAVGGALGTALFLNKKAAKMKNPIFQRLVPFAAVCAANCINIPMMRMSELKNGTPVFTATGERVGLSKKAALTGISLVTLSRCLMAMPGMVLTPMIINHGIRAGWFCKRPKMVIPAQVGLVALCVGLATPLGCALFKQRSAIATADLEPPLQTIAKNKKQTHLYYNKGL